MTILAGAALVPVSAVAAPEVGVALLTVAIVCGSTRGSLPVDAAGLGTRGGGDGSDRDRRRAHDGRARLSGRGQLARYP